MDVVFLIERDVHAKLWWNEALNLLSKSYYFLSTSIHICSPSVAKCIQPL